MLSAIRNAFSTPFASSSRQSIPSTTPAFTPSSNVGQVRWKSNLAPRRVKHRKSMKGLPISIPTGGSIKGTTLDRGSFGIRTLANERLTADQLSACMVAVKRKIRSVKGSECHMRVFPDQPICVKGNETRMGKGKGTFEFWACRVRTGKVLFEVGGGGIQKSIAQAALKLAQDRLPVRTEFIEIASGPRLGNIAGPHLGAAHQGRIVNAEKVAESVAAAEAFSSGMGAGAGNSAVQATA